MISYKIDLKNINTRNKETYKNKTCYNLETSYDFWSLQETKKELKNIFKQLKRIRESNVKYKNISFIMGVSETEGNVALQGNIHTLKRGRPPKIVLGPKIKIHLHIFVYSEDGSMMSSFCDKAKVKLEKKGFIVKKKDNNNLYNAINYLEHQCETPILGCGEFKFQKKDIKK